MGMVVRTNTMALNAYRQLGMNNSAVSKSLEKLSSGFRINRAGDDAAGLAISEKMKAQIKGLETASANAQDGISLIQTAEGNLSEVHDMLNRMVELSTKSANGTYTSTERQALQDEMDQLLDEVDRISKSANFNGTKLLNGTMGLNNEALEIGASTGYVAPGAVDISSAVSATHFGSAATEKPPVFAADFQDYKFVSGAAATGKTATATLDLKVNGQSIEIWDGTDGNAPTDITVDAAAAATAVTVDGAAIAGALDGKKVVINGYVYDAAKEGTTGVKFTYAGKFDATYNKVSDTKVPTESAEFAKVIPQGKVTVGTPTVEDEDGTSITGGTTTGRTDCPVYTITDPVAGADAVRAGAKLELTADMVKDGYTLKIGDSTFTFSESTAPTNSSTGTTIGIKGLTGDALLQSVTEQLSHKTTTIKKKDATGTEQTYTFKIGREAGKNIIEIEEEDPAAGATVGGFSEDEMKKAFSLNAKETMANTKLTITDNSKLATEEKILVDGKEYKFAKGATLDDTMSNIQTALGSAYDVTVNTVDGKGVVTISAKTASGKSPALAGSGLTLQIGDTADDFNKMNVRVADMSANGLGLEHLKKVGIMNEPAASDAIDKIKTAINTVSSTRASMGALQNRLEHTINNLDVAAENLSAANSRIRDTDMAKEMMNYTKMNVLVQSAQAMLAQANQQPQSVLQLLQ